VAEFAIPTLGAVSENSTFTVCSSLTTTPSSATLGTEVVVSLSTVDGTGELVDLVACTLIDHSGHWV
jgi:hypothetical protein